MKIGKWYETHDHRAEQLQYDSLMPEVQLNLSFMRPQILTEQWVEELKPGAGRLLILQETKIIRDLSGLFACEKRRERQFARRWKECLDEDAWIFYRLARIEYYLETDRLSSVADEDMQLLIKAEELPSAFRLSALWLLIRIQRFAYDEERKERIERLETKLITQKTTQGADMQKQWQVLTLPHREVRRILQNGSKAQLFRRMQRSQKRILSGSTADPKDIFC